MAIFDRDVRTLAGPNPWPDLCARCAASGTTLLPVPKAFARKIDGLTVPFCPDHADDWTVVKSRSRVASVVILLAMAATAALTWVIQPEVARPNDRNQSSRVMSTI